MTVLQVRKQLAGSVASASTTPQTDAEDAFSVPVVITKAAADSMAADATAETIFLVVPFACRVRGVKYVTDSGAITAHATNFATLKIWKRDSSYANQTAVASFATDTVTTDDVAANVPKAFDTISAGATSIDAGSVLTWEITKGGSGVVVRAGKIIVDIVKGAG